MNIALIGYRGTGKTSVAKLLAGKLGMKLVSTDELIEVSEGKTITEIVKEKGWAYFREKENEIIKKLNKKNCVIDCGGGVVENKENVNSLKQNSKIILLTADADIIIQRIKNEKSRPPLTDRQLTEEVKEMLEKRKKLYESAADYIVDTTNLTVEDAVDIIIKWVNAK